MRLTFSIAVLAILAAIAVLGAEVEALRAFFSIALPYFAFAFFVVGFIVRVVRWAKSPVPFRIPTTCGQEKSLPWIKQNKLDNPSSALGTFGRMALEVLFFRSLFRNVKMDLRQDPKIVYKETKWLWLFGLAFHWSFLIIFLRHFRFFAEPTPGFVGFLQNFDGFFQVGLPIIYITDVAILTALTYLIGRRLLDPKLRYISLASDYFPLFLIISIALTGVIMRYFAKTDLIAVKEFAVGLFTFRPIVIPESVGIWFFLHFFFVCCLLIYFPMSKLVHMGGIFLSPTRNLANNNRMARHVNPWKDDKRLLWLEPHTYEEYEDEFRDLMKGCGLPLEKETTSEEGK